MCDLRDVQVGCCCGAIGVSTGVLMPVGVLLCNILLGRVVVVW